MRRSKKTIVTVILVLLLSACLVTPALAATYSSYMDAYNIVQSVNCTSSYGTTDTWYGTTAQLKSYVYLVSENSLGDLRITQANNSSTTNSLVCKRYTPADYPTALWNKGTSKITYLNSWSHTLTAYAP